jgi:recombination protein RecA
MAKNTKEVRSDDLASVLKFALNEKLDTKSLNSFYSLEDPDNPTNVKEFISTGVDVLDLAISNRPHGGLPVGRIVEITGLEQTGKSVFCASVIAETQKKGGLGVYIDTENAVSKEFFEMLGVDISPDKFLYGSISTIEDVFETVETVIIKSNEKKNNRLVTICVDSVAATTTLVEMESGFSKDGYATTKALVISKAMRKLTQLVGSGRHLLVFTNQLRQILNAQAFADQWTAPGGKSIPFHASVRIRLANTGKITIKGKETGGVELVVGQNIQAKIVKNRMGPPNTKADYPFYYAKGFDNYMSWLQTLKKYNVIKVSGPTYKYVDESTGEVITFFSKDFEKLLNENTHLKEQLYKHLCDKLIVEYEKSIPLELQSVKFDEDDIQPEETKVTKQSKTLIVEDTKSNFDIGNDNVNYDSNENTFNTDSEVVTLDKLESADIAMSIEEIPDEVRISLGI